MIRKAELTQALALLGGEMNRPLTNMNPFSYSAPRRGKYGRNLNRTCKLLRRLKTTC
jgi:hypothetical protein